LKKEGGQVNTKKISDGGRGEISKRRKGRKRGEKKKKKKKRKGNHVKLALERRRDWRELAPGKLQERVKNKKRH